LPGSRRTVAACIVSLTLTVGALVPANALASGLLPEAPASSNASDARTIYIVMLTLTAIIGLGAIAALLRAVRSRGDAEPERRVRAGRGIQLRVGGALGILAVVIFVVGVVFTESSTNADAGSSEAEPLEITATGQQWLWRYGYPSDKDTDFSSAYSYYDLVVPVDTPITLQLGSTDVLHRWWVPALAGMADAVPGRTNEIDFTADETGTFYGASNQFAGPGTAAMRTRVTVVEPDEYDAYVSQLTDDIDAARAAVQERVKAGDTPGVQLEEGADQ